MKIVQQYTPPTVNLGHASAVEETNNSNAYLVFPEVSIPGKDKSIKDRAWYALFAESPPETKYSSMAAQLSIESMYRYLIENKLEQYPFRQSLESALCHANSTLRRHAQQEQIQSNFQTSALGACISHNRFYFTYVGNVHAYLLRSRYVYHLTHAVSAPTYQSNEVGHRRMTREIKPIIDSTTHLLGSETIPTVKHISFNVINNFAHGLNPFDRKIMDYLILRPGDALVLCSSSVSAALNPLEIEEVATALPSQLAAEEIVQIAKRISPNQNHTAVVLSQNSIVRTIDYMADQRPIAHQQASHRFSKAMAA